ncbi:hypothetical protein AB4Y38_36680, partial [Paraburkholderia sp. EG285A]|uniref:hypothetical protein n=1 Tax=Paraburkholderia sp. EG285A TaxID=3237009 RepID=UPI0034D23278
LYRERPELSGVCLLRYFEHRFFPSFGSSLHMTYWKAKFRGKLKSKVDRRLWHTVVTPVGATVGLGVFLYYSLVSVDVLLGVTGLITDCLVASIFVTFAIGFLYAIYIKRSSPARYENLTKALVSEQ